MLDKTILITGSNGFISKKLYQFLLNNNYKVNSTNRKKSNNYYFDLKDKNNSLISIPKFDILIHLAYFRNSSFEIENKVNLIGSANIFSVAKNYNAKIIYISSQSAEINSYSNYGKTKYNIEKIAEKFNAYIVKPGLVYDENSESGLFASIEKLIKRMPFLFVPTGLKKSIYLCNINNLFEQIHKIIHDKITQSKIEVCENEKYSLSDLINKIALKNNKKIKIFYINYKIIYYTIKIFEILKFKFSFKSDSLKSLL